MRSEAMNDLQTVFHRYVKPLWVFSVDEDNQTKIDAFKNKVDKYLAGVVLGVAITTGSAIDLGISLFNKPMSLFNFSTYSLIVSFFLKY